MNRERTGAQARRLLASTRARRPDAEKKPTSFRERLRGWVRAPVFWVLTAVAGGVAAFVGHYVQGFLGAWIPDWTSGDAVRVIDVRRDQGELEPYVVHAANVDADWLRTLEVEGSFAPGSLPEGAVSVGTMTWQVVLEGNRPSGVIVTDIRPALLEPCRSPVQGVYVWQSGQGEAPRTHLYTVIDDVPPVFYDQLSFDRATGEAETSGVRFFSERFISLAHREQYPISITAFATEQYCRWNLEVEISSGGKVSELIVPGPGGDPFELTASLDDLSGYDGVAVPSCTTLVDYTYFTGDELSEDPFPSGCLAE